MQGEICYCNCLQSACLPSSKDRQSLQIKDTDEYISVRETGYEMNDFSQLDCTFKLNGGRWMACQTRLQIVIYRQKTHTLQKQLYMCLHEFMSTFWNKNHRITNKTNTFILIKNIQLVKSTFLKWTQLHESRDAK